jgi:hypothetical protein
MKIYMSNLTSDSLFSYATCLQIFCFPLHIVMQNSVPSFPHSTLSNFKSYRLFLSFFAFYHYVFFTFFQ